MSYPIYEQAKDSNIYSLAQIAQSILKKRGMGDANAPGYSKKLQGVLEEIISLNMGNLQIDLPNGPNRVLDPSKLGKNSNGAYFQPGDRSDPDFLAAGDRLRLPADAPIFNGEKVASRPSASAPNPTGGAGKTTTAPPTQTGDWLYRVSGESEPTRLLTANQMSQLVNQLLRDHQKAVTTAIENNQPIPELVLPKVGSNYRLRQRISIEAENMPTSLEQLFKRVTGMAPIQVNPIALKLFAGEENNQVHISNGEKLRIVWPESGKTEVGPLKPGQIAYNDPRMSQHLFVAHDEQPVVIPNYELLDNGGSPIADAQIFVKSPDAAKKLIVRVNPPTQDQREGALSSDYHVGGVEIPAKYLTYLGYDYVPYLESTLKSVEKSVGETGVHNKLFDETQKAAFWAQHFSAARRFGDCANTYVDILELNGKIGQLPNDGGQVNGPKFLGVQSPEMSAFSAMNATWGGICLGAQWSQVEEVRKKLAPSEIEACGGSEHLAAVMKVLSRGIPDEEFSLVPKTIKDGKGKEVPNPAYDARSIAQKGTEDLIDVAETATGAGQAGFFMSDAARSAMRMTRLLGGSQFVSLLNKAREAGGTAGMQEVLKRALSDYYQINPNEFDPLKASQLRSNELLAVNKANGEAVVSTTTAHGDVTNRYLQASRAFFVIATGWQAMGAATDVMKLGDAIAFGDAQQKDKAWRTATKSTSDLAIGFTQFTTEFPLIANDGWMNKLGVGVVRDKASDMVKATPKFKSWEAMERLLPSFSGSYEGIQNASTQYNNAAKQAQALTQGVTGGLPTFEEARRSQNLNKLMSIKTMEFEFKGATHTVTMSKEGLQALHANNPALAHAISSGSIQPTQVFEGINGKNVTQELIAIGEDMNAANAKRSALTTQVWNKLEGARMFFETVKLAIDVTDPTLSDGQKDNAVRHWGGSVASSAAFLTSAPVGLATFAFDMVGKYVSPKMDETSLALRKRGLDPSYYMNDLGFYTSGGLSSTVGEAVYQISDIYLAGVTQSDLHWAERKNKEAHYVVFKTAIQNQKAQDIAIVATKNVKATSTPSVSYENIKGDERKMMEYLVSQGVDVNNMFGEIKKYRGVDGTEATTSLFDPRRPEVATVISPIVGPLIAPLMGLTDTQKKIWNNSLNEACRLTQEPDYRTKIDKQEEQYAKEVQLNDYKLQLEKMQERIENLKNYINAYKVNRPFVDGVTSFDNENHKLSLVQQKEVEKYNNEIISTIHKINELNTTYTLALNDYLKEYASN